MLIVTLKLEVESGEEIVRYHWVPDYFLNRDSLSNTPYLKELMSRFSGDTTWIEAARFKLNYLFKKRFKLQGLYVFERIELDDIKSMEVIGQSVVSGGMGFANISPADRGWFEQEPLRYEMADGYLCAYTYVVHEENPKLMELIQEAKELAKKARAEMNDDQGYLRIHKLMKGFKVVIIEECSC